MPALDTILAEKTAKLEAQKRSRRMTDVTRAEGAYVIKNGVKLLSFSSNDYLGMAAHPRVVQAAQDATARFGAGAGASRLVTGNHPLYAQLETALSRYKKAEAALLFGSGYLANVGVIPALVGREDLVVADKLVHACILDGIRISGAKLLRFRHNDADDAARILQENRAEHRHCLLITETIFSMDGDAAPLAALRDLCDRHGAWLMTDDAHGFGLPQPVVADVQIGTLSKALGSYGGYVVGSKTLVDYLTGHARSLIFSTGLPPAAVGAALAAFELLKEERGLSAKALVNARLFTQKAGLPLAESAIVPLILGSEERALQAAALLEREGYLVSAIRPPTVPEGTSRLRFAFSAIHEEADILHLAKVIRRENLVA